jgi:cbb3-type cytochrome oxidase subunit 1
MEASLPASTAFNPATIRSAAPQAAATTAPSVTLPLRFMLTGVIALLVGAAWLVAQPVMLATYHYNQNVIAVTHLFLLGWICSVVMGAMYQLVPVALETRLHSERLAKWQFVFHVIGFVGMVWMFHVWNMKQVGHFGSVMVFSVGLFVYNLVRTLARAPKWNVAAWSIAAALGWISITVLAGLSLAAAKCDYGSALASSSAPVSLLLQAGRSVAAFVARFDQIGAMHAHAHLGVLGFFVMLIVGISYKLVPMFTLSVIQSQRRAACSILLLNVGLAGSVVSILLRSAWKPVFALVVLAALALYGLEMSAILRARKRWILDWGIKYFLTAIALLAPLSLLAFALSLPIVQLNAFTGQLENVYGFVGLCGVVTFAIMGMLYKIIPFLVWFKVYSRHLGRAKVPALGEMYSARLQAAGYWTYLAGLAVTGAAIVFSNAAGVRVGCTLLAASLAIFAVNVGRILIHFVRPRCEAFASTIPLAATKS